MQRMQGSLNREITTKSFSGVSNSISSSCSIIVTLLFLLDPEYAELFTLDARLSVNGVTISDGTSKDYYCWSLVYDITTLVSVLRV